MKARIDKHGQLVLNLNQDVALAVGEPDTLIFSQYQTELIRETLGVQKTDEVGKTKSKVWTWLGRTKF